MIATDYWRRTGLLPYLLKRQDWKCRICGRDFQRIEEACIDHDHKTDQIRGLLCADCNRGLGFFKDDASHMKVAISYLDDKEYQGEINTVLEEHRRKVKLAKMDRLQHKHPDYTRTYLAGKQERVGGRPAHAKAKVVALLIEGNLTGSQIARTVDCSRQYVHQVKRELATR